MKILIVYGSTHGQTARIAERIATRMQSRGADVVVSSVSHRNELEGFDGIVVGGRVHGSRYPWRLTHFIRKNLAALRALPSAFFSVSLLQFSRDPKQQAQTQTLPNRALAKLGWTPERIEVIGGALQWKAQYGLLAPFAKHMWRRALGSLLDRSRKEQVFTDWTQLDRFADAFLQLVAAQVEHAQANAE